jgi:hypothetical protein
MKKTTKKLDLRLLSKKYNLPIKCIRTRIKKGHPLDMPKYAHRKILWKLRLPEIIKLRKQGLTFEEIGKKYGASRQMVWNSYNRYK